MEYYYYGLDLNWDTTQFSRYNTKTGEPEAVNTSGDGQEVLMPAVLCRRKLTGEWFAGQEALRMSARGAGDLISGLLAKLLDGKETVIDEESFPAEHLMEQYLRKLLASLRQCYGTTEITKMVVTLPKNAERLAGKILKILGRLGIPEQRILFLSHTQCFMYYCVNTPQELWINDVVVFECDEEHMNYVRLSAAKRKVPITVVSEEIDFSKQYTEELLKEDNPDRRAYWFYELAMQQLHRQAVTTVYATGNGFSGGWANGAFQKLCDGRRVFFGQNLYTCGACYAAKQYAEGKEKDYLLLAGDMIRESIFLKVFRDSKEEYVEIATAGTDYRKIDCSLRLIVDDTSEIEFLVSHALKKEPIHEVMILDNPVPRPNKTVNLSLRLYYADFETPVVQVRDLGFGEYETTRRIWEQIL